MTLGLFKAYCEQPSLMGDDWADGSQAQEPQRSRHVADYIAGMTDRFAISAYERIFGIKPEGLQNV